MKEQFRDLNKKGGVWFIGPFVGISYRNIDEVLAIISFYYIVLGKYFVITWQIIHLDIIKPTREARRPKGPARWER